MEKEAELSTCILLYSIFTVFPLYLCHEIIAKPFTIPTINTFYMNCNVVALLIALTNQFNSQ